MVGINAVPVRTGMWGGLIALGVLLAGCAEEPKPAPSQPGDVAGEAARKSEASQQPESDPVPDEPPPQGEPEPVSNVGPQPVTPEELQSLVDQSEGKLVLVDFWATWCAPCLQQMPHTVELSKKHATDLVVYAVAMNRRDEETLAEVGKVYAKHDSGNVQPLISADGDSGEAYEGFEITGGALPHYKLYGRDGKLIRSFGGDVDNPLSTDDIDKAIAAALGSGQEESL